MSRTPRDMGHPADNGNVFQIINNKDNNRTQNFLYDPLNRIWQAYTSGSNWGETFSPSTLAAGTTFSSANAGIDAWGNLQNRSGVTGKTSYEPLCCPANAHNQLTTCSLNYDAAGNVFQNGMVSYTYDAENHMISAGAGYSYIYDGDGNRVEKCTAGTGAGSCASNPSGTLYYLGLDGNTLSETDLSGNLQEEYMYFGKRIARREPTSDVRWYFSDQLGTASVIAWELGSLKSESDYYPYGGEIPITGADTNHYKFTGKERDSESNLDNFVARYYSYGLGRFMIPDWSAGEDPVPYADLSDPQSLNLYAYAGNSPTSVEDDDGHDPCGHGACDLADEMRDSLGRSATNSVLEYHEQSTLTNQALFDAFLPDFGGPIAPGLGEPSNPAREALLEEEGQSGGGGKPSTQEPSWDPSKPFPDDPSELGPDWKVDPNHDPQGRSGDVRYANDKTGNKVDWHKGVRGGKGEDGKDHWHWVPGGKKEKRHYHPGETIKQVGIGAGIGAGAGVVLGEVVSTIIDSAPEWLPLVFVF